MILNYDVCVLGAGASGMVAAICAARKGNKVTIIDRMNKVGKKIYATGNGKCNFTNTQYDYDSYRGEDVKIVEDVLNTFSYVDTIDFFEELGILAKNKNGYIYPYSEQASSVVEVLSMELYRLGVDIKTEECVLGVDKSKNNNYTVKTDKGVYMCANVIMAMGGKASPKLGSDGSGLAILKNLGHKIVAPHKALVQLKCKGKSFKAISGVRLQADVKMHISGKGKEHIVYSNYGEIIFTDYGISGIPIMQLSRYASKALGENKKVTLSLDFFPDIDYSSLVGMINKRRQRNNQYNNLKSDEELLTGMINNKLASYIVKNFNNKKDSDNEKKSFKQKANKKSPNEEMIKVKELVAVLKGMELEVVDTNSWDNAQVMAGGVSTKQITHSTMESTLHKGLYITGEIMDIDGTCGGYNLQWAWATGYIAGTSIK